MKKDDSSNNGAAVDDRRQEFLDFLEGEISFVHDNQAEQIVQKYFSVYELSEDAEAEEKSGKIYRSGLTEEQEVQDAVNGAFIECIDNGIISSSSPTSSEMAAIVRELLATSSFETFQTMARAFLGKTEKEDEKFFLSKCLKEKA